MGSGGVKLDGFEEFVEVGRGGFGVVYRADQPSLRRQVAVKVLLAATMDEKGRQRFQREASALGALSGHPSIVQIHEAGFTADGTPYLVMPFLSGGSLAERIAEEGKLGAEQVLDVGVKLCGALATAHQGDILHRDVKPANVLFDRFDEPVLGDFGIATIAGTTATKTGEVTASLAYAPPEVVNGERPTTASDVYCLAATLFAALRGSAPFSEDTDTSVTPIIARILTADPPDLSELGVPEEVSALLAEALAKDPKDRVPSAAEFGERLRETQERLGYAVTPLKIADEDGEAIPFKVVPEELGERSTADFSEGTIGVADVHPGDQSDDFSATVIRKDVVAELETQPTATDAEPPARKGRVGWLVAGIAAVILLGGGAAAFVLTGSSPAAEEAVGVDGLAGEVFSRIDDPAGLVEELAAADGLEGEARLLGSWWSLADWCALEGFDNHPRCYDLAADYLAALTDQDPRELTIAGDMERASVRDGLAAGHEVGVTYLDLATDPLDIEELSENRPGNGVLCSPTCSAVADDLTPPEEVASATEGANEDTSSDPPVDEEPVTAEPTEVVLGAPPAPPPPPAPQFTGPSRQLFPVSTTATASRRPVDLRCTGQRITYTADNLTDGDEQTGWGAGENDGTGQSATVRFGREVLLTRIGLTPGYTKIGPRSDQGCAPTLAWDFNRFVTSVRYTFDDGNSVVQQFGDFPELQYTDVNVVTSSVRITILGTSLPPGADDDTILSEAVFYGVS